MNTSDPLKELRDYVAGQVVASEKAIAYINQLHSEREKLVRTVKRLRDHYCATNEELCQCPACTIAREVL